MRSISVETNEYRSKTRQDACFSYCFNHSGFNLKKEALKHEYYRFLAILLSIEMYFCYQDIISLLLL